VGSFWFKASFKRFYFRYYPSDWVSVLRIKAFLLYLYAA